MQTLTLAPAPITRTGTFRVTAALAILFVITTALRIPGLFTDFWGDEIWSWWIAGQLHSIADVLMAAPAHIDNNHPLNTLWLYLLGQNQPVWLYRLPALLAGAGSVVLAARLMRRRGQIEAIIAAVLFGFSYPLIFYSSEARGYSFAVFFSLLSFDFLQNALAASGQKKYAMEFLFGLASVLGFLSHLTFLHIYAGALVWSIVRIRRLEPTTGLRALRLARLHAIPLIFALLLFHYFVRDMMIGGATPTSPGAVFLQTLSLTAGGTETGPLAVLAAIIMGLLFFGGLLYLAREESADWTFFLIAVAVSPALACTRDLLFSERPQPLMPRYFLVSIGMLLLSITPFLAGLWRNGRLIRLALTSGMILYVVGNLRNVGLFLEFGRGHYSEALSHIADQSPGSTLTISSDNPVRTEMLIRFYGPRVAADRRMTVTADPQTWLILNRMERSAPPTTRYRDTPYTLEGVYDYSGFSGWTWVVYARDKTR